MSSSDGDKKGKRRACTECHKCKSKCVYPQNDDTDNRCERCFRLNKECIPHKSRQGKRKTLEYNPTDHPNYNNSSEHSSPYPQQQQHNLGQQHHHQVEVTSSSQFTGPMAAALANMSNNSNMNINNHQSQYLDMIEGIKNFSVDGTTDGTIVADLLNNHSNLLNNGGGNNNFNTAASLNTHHLAQQIQNNALFAKNASLLQQQQHSQQSYGTGEGNTGLNTILSRAMGDSRNTTAATAVSTTSGGGAIDITGGNLSGFSANLLSGLTPSALNRMINHLSNNINTNSAAGSGGGGGGGGDLGSNNLDLLYHAANSQSNNAQQQQQGLVGYVAGGNQLKGSTPPTSNVNINNNMGNGGNNNNTATANMMFPHEKRRNSSTGGVATSTYPSPQLPLHNNNNNNNAKSAAAPASSSSGNTNININSNSKATIDARDQIRAADSRLKKQKKHHKFFPPEYPPVSLLRSHSISGTPSSSQAGEGENLSRSSSTQNFITPEEAIGSHYMSACARHSELTLASLKHHYGLQCQIREWISMALARRSFALLSKASSLAHRCSMHMDRILSGLDDCDEEHEHTECGKKKLGKCAGPRMHYLLSMLLEPQSKISIPIEDRHMLLPHFPPAFLSVIGCQNGQFFQESEIRNRWIIVRETRCGISRFFCSHAFERNVLCWAHVSQIYEDNLADIHSLIFVKDQFRRFLACNAFQIWSHSGEGMPPRPVHAPKTRVRLLSKRWGMAKYQDDGVTNPVTKAMIQQVDDVMTLEMDLLFVSFPTMDKTTYYLEFFHSAKTDSSTTPTVGNSSIPRGLSNVSLNMGAGEDLSQGGQQKSPESTSGNPPTFDDIMESEEWVGIDDVMASGDINQLMDALLN